MKKKKKWAGNLMFYSFGDVECSALKTTYNFRVKIENGTMLNNTNTHTQFTLNVNCFERETKTAASNEKEEEAKKTKCRQAQSRWRGWVSVHRLLFANIFYTLFHSFRYVVLFIISMCISLTYIHTNWMYETPSILCAFK